MCCVQAVRQTLFSDSLFLTKKALQEILVLIKEHQTTLSLSVSSATSQGWIKQL